MKIKQYKVRELNGEHIIFMPGNTAGDMSRVACLNETSLLLWQEFQGKEFCEEDVQQWLLSQYEVEPDTALHDVHQWILSLQENGLLEG